jgi:hypothetical protein
VDLRSAEKDAIERHLSGRGLRSELLRSGDVRTEGPSEQGVSRVPLRAGAIGRPRRWRLVSTDNRSVAEFKSLGLWRKAALAAGLVAFPVVVIDIGGRTSDIVALGLSLLVGVPALRLAIHLLARHR